MSSKSAPIFAVRLVAALALLAAPLVAQSVLAGPTWQTDSDQEGANLGFSVSPAGDVNGDGHSDLIVGAPFFQNPESFEGRALVYLGSPSGPSTTASWIAEGNEVGATFGWSVSTAGDVNGDGYSDVIVGASQSGPSSQGSASLYLGSASGLAAIAAWSAEGPPSPPGFFGGAVATAGDVNGDGYSDVLVGAPNAYGGELDEGMAYLYLGSPSGLAATPSWSAEGNQAGAYFGQSLSTAGDVNGDGYSDVLVGAPFFDFEGRAFLYLGSAAGLSSSAAWTFDGGQPGAALGFSVATAAT